MRPRDTALRILATVWIVYGLHFATNIVRESYLAMALAERATIRVDEYMGLHPDLFEIEGRGAFINNNPGVSMLGAVPYAVARPAIELLFHLRPGLTEPKEPATYEDPRPNRQRFFAEARARGLDVRFGLAAATMHVGLMAPLGGLAAALLFLFLRRRLGDDALAAGLALLYAFGTPVFFRSGYLSQNAVFAQLGLLAFLALAADARGIAVRGKGPMLAGLALGTAVLCDYSAVPFLAVFGLWVLLDGRRWAGGDRCGGGRRGGAPAAGPVFAGRPLGPALHYVAGALPPLAVLLAYQWAAFGNPLLPAQAYMPDTRFSVEGWHGFALPTAELLWRNLLDPAYGLFVFCPMLVAALAAPLVVGRGGGSGAPGAAAGPAAGAGPATAAASADVPGVRGTAGTRRRLGQAGLLDRSELLATLGACLGLYLFSSANRFGLLQWNTGVRYLVPAGSLLFLALVPVLLRLPRLVSAALVLPTLAVSWSVAMVRESVPTSLARVFLGGFELPWLTVLEKTASAYAPFLEDGASPLPLFVLVGAALWVLWRPGFTSSRGTAPGAAEGSTSAGPASGPISAGSSGESTSAGSPNGPTTPTST